jgi:hypothetical protein
MLAMAVVINEFEIVPAPAATGEKGSGEGGAAPRRQEPDPNQVAALMRLARERAQRVRAH